VLRHFAEWNPVSSLSQSIRQAFGNTVPFLKQSDAWSLNHPVVYTLMWIAVILAIFIPLSVRQYRRSAARA
jgi:hypothetical protein